MRTVLSRSLNVYADRHAGRRPRTLVVHKTYPLTDEEAHGATEAWGRSDGLTCISLTKSAWRGVLVTAARNDRTGGPKYGYAVDRGTLAQLDGHSGLLWVGGNARDATLNNRSYLQGGKGTPRPLLLTRHTGAGPLAEPAAQVLALSKMDWNTDALYSSPPPRSPTRKYSPASSNTRTCHPPHSTTGCSCSHAEQRAQASRRR